jgi:hypothetical protein
VIDERLGQIVRVVHQIGSTYTPPSLPGSGDDGAKSGGEAVLEVVGPSMLANADTSTNERLCGSTRYYWLKNSTVLFVGSADPDLSIGDHSESVLEANGGARIDSKEIGRDITEIVVERGA